MDQNVRNNVSHQESRHASESISTGNVPIQCEENPEGQNGFVIFENRSHTTVLADSYVEDRGRQHFMHREPQQNRTALQVPVQCEENPEGQNGCVIVENISYIRPVFDADVLDQDYQSSVLRVPVQCEENPEGHNGCVIFENRSDRLSHGSGSSEHCESVLHGSVELDSFFYTVELQPRVEDHELIREDEDFLYAAP